MMLQFIIVNNGTTELRGHYMETAISVAEAARDAEFEPILGLHVNCPVTDLPEWLARHLMFRVDHWAEKVHFDPPPAVPPPGRTARLKALVKSLVPRFLRNYLRRPARPCTPLAARADGGFDESQVDRLLAQRTSDPESNHEVACARLFQKDLDRLLRRIGSGSLDHVFLPTAHFREAYAIRRLIHAWGAYAPCFHLEYRHGIIPANDPHADVHPQVKRYSKIGEIFFEACREYPNTERLRCYTDTEELAEDYRQLCGVPFGVLPIPFSHELIRNSATPGAPPYACAYLGDVREEKGFQLLPELVRAVLPTGKVRFLLQGTQIHPSAQTPALMAAMTELESYAPGQVELVGHDKSFLHRDEYYELLGRADIVLCLHLAHIYRARSSGILTEAIAAGKPVIVPADTWLAHQLPSGCGETFTDADSLVCALRKIADRYELYHARLQECRGNWLAKHSSSALLQHLVGEPQTISFGQKAA